MSGAILATARVFDGYALAYNIVDHCTICVGDGGRPKRRYKLLRQPRATANKSPERARPELVSSRRAEVASGGWRVAGGGWRAASGELVADACVCCR